MSDDEYYEEVIEQEHVKQDTIMSDDEYYEEVIEQVHFKQDPSTLTLEEKKAQLERLAKERQEFDQEYKAAQQIKMHLSNTNITNDDEVRIVSLLPSITEILAALGLSDQIVGVTHCCDYPPSALKGATVVTTSEVRPAELTQEEIHERISGSLRKGDSLYALDEDALKRINPTHVFTQSLCDICAVSAPLVKSTCARIFPGTSSSGPNKVISLEPQTLDDVWDTVRIAGRELGLDEKAEQVIKGYGADLEEIEKLVNDYLVANNITTKPKVAFLEWHDPFVSGGHWIADMMKIAGGDYTLNKSGHKSECISDEDLLNYDPEIILIGPCGFTVERATKDTLPLLNHKTRSCWKQLRAVQDEKVYALDGNSFYARPGPRLVQGTGLMAKCLYPDMQIPERLAPSIGMKQITLDMYVEAEE